MPLLAVSFLESSGISLAIVCAFIGLGFALYLIKSILSSPPGNEKMREIASAIQGLRGYRHRRVSGAFLLRALPHPGRGGVLEGIGGLPTPLARAAFVQHR